MTSLLPAPARVSGPDVDPRHRRPLVAVAALGGLAAAATVLVVCLGVAVVGWFLSDAASHGEPRDALRVGALGWLMAHTSAETGWVMAVPVLRKVGWRSCGRSCDHGLVDAYLGVDDLELVSGHAGHAVQHVPRSAPVRRR